ncbi:MAG: ferrous iron transport protein A [Treponema sp.]|jgi:ferrous iron transport protein A|nr:ferrous iron transport protein A [Treponema sp.]
MPLAFSKTGEAACIKGVGGTAKSRQRLETLGFTVGSEVTVVSRLAGNLIVNVRDSRIAISREAARSIFV